ncbi:hypothetical protein [Shewanella dokdonensis]|uniref:Uncharacterized protein n=1 Tax=Shewanella dokdonensis TaxID=712036 RepID=A0ABX8DBV5_9GAMM|nr:hypothetical protein [Shewanella dokdonensis]MCL1074750.1 hypothetical protein [Shewanella dokdonensis]QVK22269.1 hypothetical protein KHX94_12690 [Shewanella dokdonensis]
MLVNEQWEWQTTKPKGIVVFETSLLGLLGQLSLLVRRTCHIGGWMTQVILRGVYHCVIGLMANCVCESRGTARSTPEPKGDARPATTSMFNGQLAIHGSRS